jgi:D-sedoheptulose 7-phosphate isomerase
MNYAESIKKAKRVYVCGNGGSASTANHFVNDLVKMCGIRAYSLCSNEALLTAYANDDSFDNIFVDQLKVYAEPGDLIILISTSGRSNNILNVIRWAVGINCISFPIFDVTITQAEDLHLSLAHSICEAIHE